MNDLLQQLIALSPGIVSGVRGNGHGMNAFMDGFMRQRALMDENERRNQQMQLQQQDRETAAQRQRMLDERTATADQRAAQDQEWQNTQRSLAALESMMKLGASAPTQEMGESAVDAAYGVLPPAAQQSMAPMRDQAIAQIAPNITARQQRQVKEFVDDVVKTSYVADNPDADPEVTNLPAHLQKVLGKPTAKLSELQMFAQMPVGKPQGKTRVPAAAGSFEDFVQRKYGDAPTADQILEGRKLYGQADDKPTINVNLPGGLSKQASDAALKFQDDYARDSKPYLTMREAYQRVKSAQPDAAGDLSLIFAYMKILDPNSVVREQEFANAQNATGVPARIRNTYNRMMKGERLNPEQRAEFVAQADALFESAKTNQRQVRGTYADRAKQWGIPENMVLDAEDQFLSGQSAAPKFKPGQKVRNKKTGEVREVTGVRPDGSPILGPVKQ